MYCALCSSKLELASLARKYVTSIRLKVGEFEKYLQGYAVIHFLLSFLFYSYSDSLVSLNMSTPQSRQWHLDARYVINIFMNQICCSSILNNVSLRISAILIRNCSVFDALSRAL